MQLLQEDCLENITNMQEHVAKLVDGIQVVERLIENEQAMEFQILYEKQQWRRLQLLKRRQCLIVQYNRKKNVR